MRILQICKLYNPWIGGVEEVAKKIAEGVHSLGGVESIVLCCQPKGKYDQTKINEIQVNRAASLGMLWGMPISFDFLKRFRRLSKTVDVIDLHIPFPLADLAVLLTKPNAKLVVHYHADIVRQKILKPLFGPLIRNTLKRADFIVVSSPNLIESSKYLKNFKEKCKVINFGLDVKEYACANPEQINTLIARYGDFTLFVGRMSYYKGVDFLINAIKSTSGNLVLVGTGPEESRMKNLVKKLELKDRVIFLKNQSNAELINLFHAAQVMVLPSIYRSEAFGLVLLEAMACGTPVISTELGTGTSWVNKHNETGIVVPPSNVSVLADAINRIAKDKQLRQRLGEGAKMRATYDFSMSNMIFSIAKLYNIPIAESKIV
ncbi:MAG: glycosyltransferase [Candidatus Uhrbacteria bacterium]|nr:glycosyltransferase [Candidatus Uhrbacteria bacterium]